MEAGGGAGQGLERAAPHGKGLHPGGFALGFLLIVLGGAGLYLFEGWLAFNGAFPTVVIWLTFWGYAVWVLFTARSWYGRHR